MALELVARNLKESEFERWNELVLGNSIGGSIYALTTYLEVLSDVTEGTFSVLGVFRGDELLGGLPIYEKRTRLGAVVENRLLLHYNGMVLKRPEGTQEHKKAKNLVSVLVAIEKGLKKMQWAHLVLNQRGEVSDLRPFLKKPWRVTPTYTYLVPLGDIPALWESVDKNVRRLVRNAEADGYVVECSEDFEPFYDLHFQVHRRKGAPLYLGRERFRTFFTKLHQAKMARLYYARSGMGEVGAGLLVLAGKHSITHSVCAVSDGAHLKAGATPFLRWRVFEALAADGYQANDLTDASLNEVSNFKAQLGGKLSLNFAITRPDRFDYALGTCLREAIEEWRN